MELFGYVKLCAGYGQTHFDSDGSVTIWGGLTIPGIRSRSATPKNIRRIARLYCKDELLNYTLKTFDASLVVSALVSLEYEPRNDGMIATGLKIMSDAAGEGGQGHPYKAYEWNHMRHPTRILVGSGVSTSLFVLRTSSEAMRYLYGENWSPSSKL